jgi:RNA polymerase sigma-70 factor (ECF subfamily)
MPQGPIDTEPLSRHLAEARFARLYAEYGRDVLAYALRRTARPEDAADAVADTFLVVWRRAGEVPSGSQARLWLYGVARRTLANQQRGEQRRTRLAERLRRELPSLVPVQSAPDAEGGAVLHALGHLSDSDRELLLLVGWEGLDPAEAARALGISAVTARSRLHRARRRLRKALEAQEPAAPTNHSEPELGKGE